MSIIAKLNDRFNELQLKSQQDFCTYRQTDSKFIWKGKKTSFLNFGKRIKCEKLY